jgi:macrolide transport system ATP-binding/permease protein
VESARVESRFVAVLCASLGAVALMLSCIGIYGVTSSAVSSRTREIGIRMALGAQGRQILLMVLRGSMTPVIAGAAVGAAMAVALMPLIRSLLFGVRAVDPGVMMAVLVCLCAVGVVASMVPAERVVRGNPVGALRE